MILAIVGGLVVFLLGCIVVMLAAILRHLRGAVGLLCRVLGEQTEEGRRQAEETHKHRDATAAIVVGAVREVGRAIVGELRRAADERRRVLERLMDGEPASVPPPSGAPVSSVRAGAPVSSMRGAPNARGAPSTLRSLALVRAGAVSVPPDASNPASGYPATNLLAGRAEREGDAR